MGQGLKLDSRAPWLHKMLFQHFTVQENAVLQTFICSISGVAFTGGFGTYLTGKAAGGVVSRIMLSASKLSGLVN
jgi:hypothetical protein